VVFAAERNKSKASLWWESGTFRRRLMVSHPSIAIGSIEAQCNRLPATATDTSTTILTVRLAVPADAASVVDVIGAAFLNDPYMVLGVSRSRGSNTLVGVLH
jgi:hypothetical protein